MAASRRPARARPDAVGAADGAGNVYANAAASRRSVDAPGTDALVADAPVTDAPGADASEADVLAGFAPVLDARTRLLILGSFPGVASLNAARYYAHPRNQFWRLIGAVLDEDLASLAYSERLERLLSHGVGLWDVLAACHREGSLDTAIRHARPNDFADLRARAPRLGILCFNGRTAGRFAPRLAEAGYATHVLPSSSPAHAAMSFEDKLAAWRRALGECPAGAMLSSDRSSGAVAPSSEGNRGMGIV